MSKPNFISSAYDNFAGFDVRRNAWYDRLTVDPRKMLPTYKLFCDPLGTPIASSFKDQTKTNLVRPNQLPPPVHHKTERIICLSASDNADVEQFRAQYTLEFVLDQKTFAKVPLLKFPLWGKLEVERVPCAKDADQNITMARAILPDLQEPWCHELTAPVIILPMQFFEVRLTGQPFAAFDDIDIMILLDGATAWGVQ